MTAITEAGPPPWHPEGVSGVSLADPLPERRVARLLAGFIAAGIFFLVAPGTLAGVYNLLNISANRASDAAGAAWVQAHGHAQLFGWVATFIFGISLYTLPKFRGGWVRSIGLGWAMLALWSAAILARWAAAVYGFAWRLLLPLSAAVELAVVVLLIWQTSAGRRPGGPWVRPIFAGFAVLAGVFVYQFWLVTRPLASPVLPAEENRLMLHLALWGFCFPVVWGYSGRFLPSFLGLKRVRTGAIRVGLAVLAAGLLAAVAGWPKIPAALVLAAVLLAAFSLRIFEPAVRPAKTNWVDPRYPLFARSAWAWLTISAVLTFGADSPGMLGASRHAFTVGFLAMLIFSVGPRILPSFLNSRELFSTRLMLAAMVLLTTGCVLRVVSEPFAYAGWVPLAWRVLPVSAVVELSAVLVFALNLGITLATRPPVWMNVGLIDDNVSVYWLVTAYPATRRLLGRAGLEVPRGVPRTLTLAEAARKSGLDTAPLIAQLREHFERRLARALRPLTRTAEPRSDRLLPL